ncbi:hypothetical protein [Providencia rettgeri]|uniref:hypothetical protein n=1 Tax=Providencia rettgeri TaxID=587 RepID=UPI002360F062|nr:hypothetical protein [Providencia rettgeri]
MLPEITASITAVRESLNLLKAINDAKTESEIRNATFELQRKLQDIQMDNLKLIDLVYSYKTQVDELTQRIDEKIAFKGKVEGYSPHTLKSGTFTYINDSAVNESNDPHYLCANCYQKEIVSILQPCGIESRHFQSYCPHCNNKYLMERTKPIDPKAVASLLP